MNGTGRGGKAQEEDQIGIEEYSASGAPAGGKPHESHAGGFGDKSDACSAHSRRRTGRGEVGFRDFFRGGQSHSQAHADREYSEPVQVAFDAGVECAEEQEKGVNRRDFFAGFWALRCYWGAFFCGGVGGEASREQIPRSARDDRLLLLHELICNFDRPDGFATSYGDPKAGSPRKTTLRQKKRAQSLQIVPAGEKLFECYSGMGAVSGICNLALASARTIFTSTACSDVLRTVASSLIRRYFARSSIFFSRKESALVRLRATRPFKTAATSISEPVRMRSEFSLKRCFQSWCEAERLFSRNPRTAAA